MINWIKEQRKDQLLLYYILLLIPPALLINTGLNPFILDEATRADVALEMIFSGDFLHPTINGEPYLNKPPLFNWLQVISCSLTGNFSEFSFRLPVIISLLLFGFTVYTTQKEMYNRKVAFLSALALITSGRILFYDSFRGLMDISFSWIIYLLFWSVYRYGMKKDFKRLFISSYLFASVAFLMKGMPAFVFLAISLLAFFIYTRQFRKLFTTGHLLGFVLMALVLSAYLVGFSRNVPLSEYFGTLWSESSKRTFLDNSLWDSIKHLFEFPLDFVYHFAPWSLLLVLLLKKGNRKKIGEHQASRIFLLLVLANIPVYWLSPAIFPRYLFMFLPLLFGILFHVLEENKGDWMYRMISLGLGILSVCLILLMLASPWLADRSLYGKFWISYGIILVLILALLLMLKKGYSNIPAVTIAVLLVSRITFNLYVLPDRLANESHQKQKNGAILAGQISDSRPLLIVPGTRIHHASSFYIMRERKETLLFSEGEFQPEVLYIIEKEKREEYPPHEIIYEFETRIEATKLCLVRFIY